MNSKFLSQFDTLSLSLVCIFFPVHQFHIFIGLYFILQKVPENPLTEEMVGECLSLLCKTGDGLAHAFVRLDIHERYMYMMLDVKMSHHLYVI